MDGDTAAAAGAECVEGYFGVALVAEAFRMENELHIQLSGWRCFPAFLMPAVTSVYSLCSPAAPTEV